MLGHEAVAATLTNLGVDHLFGVMGDGNMAMITHFGNQPRTRYVAARHENGAVCMATGYARASGRVGVASVTHGPGVSNAITAIRAAHTDHGAVVVLVGDTPVDEPFHLQNLDHAALVATAGVRFRHLDDAATLGDDLATVLHEAEHTQRPICVNLSSEMLAADGAVPASGPHVPTPPVAAACDPDALGLAVNLLLCAERPVVLAGAGAKSALLAVAEIADLTGALLSTTLLAHGAFRAHPRNLGVAGGFSTPSTRERLAECDVLLVVGASLSDHTTAHGTLFNDTAIIQIDTDPAALIRRAPRVALQAEAAPALEQLLDLLCKQVTDLPGDLPVGLRPFEQTPVEELHDDDSAGVDPRRVFDALNEQLNAERTVVTDGGHFIEWPCRGLDIPDLAGFLLSIGAGAVGMGLPSGLGAAIGRPERQCVVVAGDGGLLMALPELETAARERVDVLIVVVNDGAYAAEVHKLRAQGLPDDLAYFDNPSFVDLARSLGMRAAVVETTDQIAGALADIVPVSGPRLLEIKANPAVVSSRLRTS